MDRDVSCHLFAGLGDMELFYLRSGDGWKVGTTQEQKENWRDRFDGVEQDHMPLAGNKIPYMHERVFSLPQLKDYIKQLVDKGDLEAVKWLAHIGTWMTDGEFVMISSC